MSLTFSLSGNSSTLTADFNPPIYLNDNEEYEIGLINFESFNVIPNIDETNNQFIFHNSSLTIPTGAYEIKDLVTYIKKNVPSSVRISIEPNRNNSTVSILSNVKIDFTPKNSIGSILGFKRRILNPDQLEKSDFPVQIIKINALCIDCNIANGSFSNGKPSHIIHEFFPTVPPGYKIVETPQNVLYFPVNVKTINSISVKVVDQNGEIVNFREETISLRLHLRRV